MTAEKPSAVAQVSRALELAHAFQATLNVFTTIDDEGALSRAAAIDEAVERGDQVGPLAGMPLALKDLIDHQGQVNTCGSAFYRARAEESAPVVGRLEEAGGVIIGRTGLHEFAFGFSSENPHFGPVRNPWDPATSTGGSSGGSAAAVAAGITPIAIGTDTGGSVRVPAALCGTYGLKVTHGKVPLAGVFPLVPSVDTVGPLADSVEHLELAYRIMSGDSTDSAPGRIASIGIPEPWCSDAPLADEVAVEFARAVDLLGEAGHEVSRVKAPDLLPSTHILAAIAPEVREVHAEFRRSGQPYGEDVEQRIADAEQITDAQIEEARVWQERLRRQFATQFEENDFLLTPTVPVRRKRIGVDTIAGQHYRPVFAWFTSIVNHALCPAITLPVLRSGTPPISIQLIGPADSEPTLLSLARSLEQQEVVGFRPPDPRLSYTQDA